MPAPRAALLAVCLTATAARAEGFVSAIEPISASARQAMMDVSWKPGCPVAIDDLVALRLSYVGFDGGSHAGTMVVHRKLAEETVAIFRELFEARFAIARMEPYETFAIGAYAAANDTVGFYCRPDQGHPDRFGMHSYGFAIDINPLDNPYLDAKEGWWPAGSASNAERARTAPGLLTTQSPAFDIFTRHGWLWGGLERDAPDYMHFQKATFGAHPNPAEAIYSVTGLTYQK